MAERTSSIKGMIKQRFFAVDEIGDAQLAKDCRQ